MQEKSTRFIRKTTRSYMGSLNARTIDQSIAVRDTQLYIRLRNGMRKLRLWGDMDRVSPLDMS